MIADLLGVPEPDHETFREALQGSRRPDSAVGSTDTSAMTRNPLEFLYQSFTTYIEDRRREPRDDVLTGLATATFPDGSTPRGGSTSSGSPPTCSPPGRRRLSASWVPRSR